MSIDLVGTKVLRFNMRMHFQKNTLKQFPAFGMTGAAGFLTNLSVTTTMKSCLGLPTETAYLAGYVSALIVSFILCRHIVFKASDQSPREQLASFLFSSLIFRGFEYAGSLYLHKVLEFHYLLSLTVITFAFFFIKFIYYRNFVFGKSRPA